HAELIVEVWTELDPDELPFRLTVQRPRLDGVSAAIFHPKPPPASDLAQRFNAGQTHCHKCAFFELARSFPCMRSVDLFERDPHRFGGHVAEIASRIPGGGHGYQCALKFLAHVWNPHAAATLRPASRRFDVSEALGCWDHEHRQAFANW